jgi:hypothetical protein
MKSIDEGRFDDLFSKRYSKGEKYTVSLEDSVFHPILSSLFPTPKGIIIIINNF